MAEISALENLARSIEIATLPFVILERRNSLPCCPAVYFVLSSEDSTDKVLYIGQSKTLISRWRNHGKLAIFRRFNNVRIAWLQLDEEDRSLLPDIEKALIDYYQPKFNQKLPLEEIIADEEVNLCIRIPLSLRRHWMVEAKKEQITITDLVIEMLENRYGKPIS